MSSEEEFEGKEIENRNPPQGSPGPTERTCRHWVSTLGELNELQAAIAEQIYRAAYMVDTTEVPHGLTAVSRELRQALKHLESTIDRKPANKPATGGNVTPIGSARSARPDEAVKCSRGCDFADTGRHTARCPVRLAR